VLHVHLGRRWIVVLAGCALLCVAATATPAASPLPLKARLMVASEFPGYERSRVVVVDTPAGWAHATRWIAAKVLRRIGFATAGYADLKTTSLRRRTQTSVLSTVVQFHSVAGAAFYAYTFLRVQPAQVKHFYVRGVPHAYGLRYGRPGGGGFYEVGFVDGRFVYDVTAFTTNAALPPSQAQTARAAARWYRRVHGRPAS
jgi:hypothetical protein